MTTTGHKSVSRIDQPRKRNHGFQVRVVFKKKLHTKFFSDSVNGGRRNALRMAVNCRDRMERDLGKPRTDRNVMAVRPKPRNNTGVLGVFLSTQNTNRRGKFISSPAYFARWCHDGRPMSASFSVRKWGKKRAFMMARKKRRQMEELMNYSAHDG